jgi:hypothetical protein
MIAAKRDGPDVCPELLVVCVTAVAMSLSMPTHPSGNLGRRSTRDPTLPNRRSSKTLVNLRLVAEKVDFTVENPPVKAKPKTNQKR